MNITRVSVDSEGNQGNQAPYSSATASISADGRFVAFESNASNLVPGDTNNAYDIFVRDTLTNTTTRVSVDSAGNQANSISGEPSISGNGRFVAFSSMASNLVPGDTNDEFDTFVRDTLTNTTTRVSVDSAGNQANSISGEPSISANGRFVAFSSDASNLVPGDTNSASDIFVRDTVTNTTTRVSVDSAGNQVNNTSVDPYKEGGVYSPSISADGRFVAFQSNVSNLVPGDTNDANDIFVRDTVTNTTTRVSVDSEGNQSNPGSVSFSEPSISGNGRFVAFGSFASNLVPGDTNDQFDIFVRDTLTNTTTRVSVDAAGNQANNGSNNFSISANGRFVAFDSAASNLVPGDTNDASDIFVRDTLTNTNIRVSVDAVGNQVGRYGGCDNPSISADGQRITFDSEVSNLVPGDTNDARDIFVSDIGNTLGNNPPGVNGNDIIIGVEKKDVLIGLRTNNIIVRGGNRGNDVFVLNVAAKFEIDTSVYFAQFQDIAQLIDGLTFGQLSISPAPQDPLIEVANGGEVLASLIALLFISWVLKILFRSKV